MLHIYVRPILALSCFLSALCVLSIYFSQQASASLLVLGLILFIFAYWITPYVYQQQRQVMIALYWNSSVIGLSVAYFQY